MVNPLLHAIIQLNVLNYPSKTDKLILSSIVWIIMVLYWKKGDKKKYILYLGICCVQEKKNLSNHQCMS